MKKETFVILATTLAVCVATAVEILRPGPVTPILCPEPARVTALQEEGEIRAGTVILFAPDAPGAEAAANFLAGCWRAPTGYPLPVQPDRQPLPFGAIRFVAPASPEECQPPEGYLLRVNQAGVRIVASDPAGFFYGAQTLRQLLADRKSTRLNSSH